MEGKYENMSFWFIKRVVTDSLRNLAQWIMEWFMAIYNQQATHYEELVILEIVSKGIISQSRHMGVGGEG